MSCICIETRNARGVTPLIEALKSVGGWPIMGQSGGYNDSEFDWKDAFVKHVITSKSSPVFVLSVLNDAKNNVVKRLHVGLVYSNVCLKIL